MFFSSLPLIPLAAAPWSRGRYGTLEIDLAASPIGYSYSYGTSAYPSTVGSLANVGARARTHVTLLPHITSPFSHTSRRCMPCRLREQHISLGEPT